MIDPDKKVENEKNDELHEIELKCIALGQIPGNFLCRVVSRRRRLLQNITRHDVAKPGEILVLDRFVGEAVVTGEEETQRLRRIEWLRHEPSREPLSTWKAGQHSSGFAGVRLHPVLKRPRICRI